AVVVAMILRRAPDRLDARVVIPKRPPNRAEDIQALTAGAKCGQASPTNERNKAQVKASFEDFRVGLDQLEIYFRTTPELQPYYVKLAGSASGAANAEDLAAAGHFTQAGRSLIGVVGRLADVLVAMR